MMCLDDEWAVGGLDGKGEGKYSGEICARKFGRVRVGAEGW